VYCLTPAGQERVTEWMSDVSWPRPDLAEFHMKLIAAAQGALADPISLIDAQRRDLPLASTLFPAIRAARMSTVSALADAPRLPRRRESLIRLSRKLPVPALVGLRLVARRPRRAILSAASFAVTVMGLVAALAIHAAVDNKFAHFGSSGGLVNPDVPQAIPALPGAIIGVPLGIGLFTVGAHGLNGLMQQQSAATAGVGADRIRIPLAY
jgi:hypothetical protein